MTITSALNAASSGAGFQLAFVVDRNSGTPKLRMTGPTPVRQEELKPWEDELNRRFEDLTFGPAVRDFEFSTPVRKLPRKYRLEVHRSRTRGAPTLLLIPLSSPPAGPDQPPPSAAGDAVGAALPAAPAWPAAGFVAALHEFFRRIPLNPAEDLGVRHVLDELRELAQGRDDQLLLMLLAGYLRFCNDRQPGTVRHLAYSTASYAVDELCSVLLQPAPPGAPAPSLYDRHVRELFRRAAGQE
jgi:hypothetical protein